MEKGFTTIRLGLIYHSVVSSRPLTEEGYSIPIYKAVDGNYLIEGEFTICTKEMQICKLI
jgi:hypothetical protein